MNIFPLNVIPTTSQLSILESKESNLIIEGIAGTGKTFLTILIAEKLMNENPSLEIAIIILTKSLKKFILESLYERNISGVKVFYENEFSYNKKNYIIIDEAQDFNVIQIKSLIKCAVDGTYILGDTNQRILDTNNGNPTTTIEELKKELNFKHKVLIENVRFHKGVKNLICETFPTIKIGNPIGNSVIKPKIIPCGTKENEVKKLIEILKEGKLKESTGILFQKNDDITYVLNLLQNEGIENIGYKYKFIEQLDFSCNSINLLTYHSAKGLEFSNVILPFLDFSLDIPNLFYVAFSRAREILILLYSENFPIELKLNQRSLNFDGEIKRPQEINLVKNEVSFNAELLNIYMEYNNKDIESEQKIKFIKEEIKEDIIELKELGVEEKEINKFLKQNNLFDFVIEYS